MDNYEQAPSHEAYDAQMSGEYVLRLYVAGTTTRSMRAIRNIKELCNRFLSDQYSLEVIDIYQKPKLASVEQIIAVPTLVKMLPEPLRRFIGDLSNTESLIAGLDLK